MAALSLSMIASTLPSFRIDSRVLRYRRLRESVAHLCIAADLETLEGQVRTIQEWFGRAADPNEVLAVAESSIDRDENE